MILQWMRVVSSAIPYLALFLALMTYGYNSRTKRAEFIYKLHTDFFVSMTYKEVRLIFDCTDVEGRQKSRAYVERESEALMDYFNFFEMIAYLQKSKQLKKKDVNALFGYYLNCLKADSAVRDYLRKDSNSFENLARMLDALE